MSYQRKILFLKTLFLGLSLYMVYLVVDTSLKSNLAEAIPVLSQHPWFNTTIVDFYFNIAVISAWAVMKERNLLVAIIWIVSFICLGSIATCFYVFLQLNRLQENEPIEHIFIRKV